MTATNSSLALDQLNEAFMNNMDIIKQILGAFKESFQSFEKEFNEIKSSGDLDALSRLAHGLKGSAANIRAEHVSQKAAALQYCFDEGRMDETLAQDTIQALDELLLQIEGIIQS